jgi:hypothetical protein
MLIGNFGRRQMGKTTLAIYMADKVDRRALLDPRALVRRPGAVIVRSARRLREAFDALAAGDCDEIVYTPVDEHRAAFNAFASELRRWVIEYPALDLAVVIDEASFYEVLDPRLPPASRADFNFAIKSCDLDRVHVIVTCHRPADLAPDVRALMNRWCLFRTRQEHDLAVIRERCDAAVVDAVQDLADRHFVMWDDDAAEWELNDAPFVWRVDVAPRGAAAHLVEIA